MAETPLWLQNNGETAALYNLLKPDSGRSLESLAAEASAMTRRRFGRTITLYAPLYLSNHCANGCAYCGFASDRKTPRRRLEMDDIRRELQAMKTRGVTDILLLTGERTPSADFNYLRQSVALAAEEMQRVAVEAFPMTTEEYKELAECGCTSVTMYQETYNQAQYEALHRWGLKKDFLYRLETPARALEAGIKHVGLGILLGLADPVEDALCLFRHLRHLERRYWRAGFSISFPRLRPESGGYQPPFPVDDRQLARMIMAFRIALPNIELVLSTRESAQFRDGMATLGITRMSVESRTTVGGYTENESIKSSAGQFEICDDRNVETFCSALQKQQIEPIFKNWERAYNAPASTITTAKPHPINEHL